MAKVKYIPCDIYKRGIDVFIGTPRQLIKWAKNTYNSKEDADAIKDLETISYGEADFHWINGHGIVRLPKFPTTPHEIAYTAHELLHATCYILWYSGVEFNNEEVANEAYTYLLEHLTRNTLEESGYEKC